MYTYCSFDCIVVSGKRIEGAELSPSCTELFIGVTIKPADVSSHQRNAEQIEVQNSCQQSVLNERLINYINDLRVNEIAMGIKYLSMKQFQQTPISMPHISFARCEI